jgi:hypothetical protein
MKQFIHPIILEILMKSTEMIIGHLKNVSIEYKITMSFSFLGKIYQAFKIQLQSNSHNNPMY